MLQHSHSFPAPKSIGAVRPLDQLTTSAPATHTHAPIHTHTHYTLRMFLVTYIVQFVVKAAGVTDRVPVPVAPPQGGGGGLAVCAAGACTSSGRLEETEKHMVNNELFKCCVKVSEGMKRQ